ncbi:helix-turn-helix domain-containing protein [Serratia quinivorans]|uniref:transcriptional regulator n=1 Tax=Serratia quinivorans TaxID=137545 RepID=UPI002E78A6F7|nr:helix-turn-helix domain-containing protein [Serratia quinivorans]
MVFKPIDMAIQCAGSQAALAKLCGVSQATVWKWRHGRRIRVEHVMEIVKATDGQIKPYELRPDIPAIFPHPAIDDASA